jgi:preprotein translocase subunit SecG
MFGPKTNTFLTRTTTTLAILFFITCLTLAFLSAKQGRSLMKDVKTTNQQTSKQEIPKQEVPIKAQEKTAAQPAQQPQEKESQGLPQ